MSTVTLREKLYRVRHLLLIPVLGVIFTLTAFNIVDPVEYANNDFFTFWLSGRLALAGQDPYVEDTWVGGHHQFGSNWIPNRTFIYPLPISLFFAPFGLLSVYRAYLAWVILSQFMITLSLALLLKFYPPDLVQRFLLPMLAGVVLFRPVLLTLHHGQLSALLLLTVVLVLFFWEQGKWWQGSVFLPILALKPNLGVPIILLLTLYLLLRRQITAAVAAAASGLGLLFAGLLQNPKWVFEFWQAGNNKLAEMFGFSPTVWGISAYFCRYDRGCTLLYGGSLGLLLLVSFIFFLVKNQKNLPPTAATSLVVTVVLLLTPYTWPYDQLLLLIPIVTVIMGLAKTGYRFLPVALLFITLDIFAFIMLGISATLGREFWNVVIPFSTLLLLVWYLSKTFKAQPAHSKPST